MELSYTNAWSPSVHSNWSLGSYLVYLSQSTSYCSTESKTTYGYLLHVHLHSTFQSCFFLLSALQWGWLDFGMRATCTHLMETYPVWMGACMAKEYSSAWSSVNDAHNDTLVCCECISTYPLVVFLSCLAWGSLYSPCWLVACTHDPDCHRHPLLWSACMCATIEKCKCM